MSLNLLLASTRKPRACIRKSRGFLFFCWRSGSLQARHESGCLHNKIVYLAAPSSFLAASSRHPGMSDVSYIPTCEALGRARLRPVSLRRTTPSSIAVGIQSSAGEVVGGLRHIDSPLLDAVWL